MSWYEEFLKKFFHDPIDKLFDIPTHELRAKKYAEMFGIELNREDWNYSDQIASCMERSVLPKSPTIIPEKIKQELNEIRHPFSDGMIEIKGFKFETAILSIEKVFEEVASNYKDKSDQEKSFLIWRNLLEELIEKLVDQDFKKFISILPADTRIPDHSIWEHLKITSAINAYERIQNNSLFIFTIGPVQSFISCARKTQDFYIGSFMLSYLTFIAMTKIIEKFGPTSIIYPELYRQPLMDWYLEKKKYLSIKNSYRKEVILPTIPNRFVAIIGTTDKKEIKDLVGEIKNTIKEEIKKAREKILEKLRINLTKKQEEDISKQFLDFPQIYWVAIPWRKGEKDLEITDLEDCYTKEKIKNWEDFWKFIIDNGEFSPNIGLLYQLIYTALEKSLGARKNLREFKQYCEIGRKCSICGERNIIFYWESKNKVKFTRNNPNAIDLTEKISEKYFSDGEGLCSLCFIKRTFDIYLKDHVDEIFKDFSFPSTAEVACSDFKGRAIRNAKDKFEQYVKKFFEIAQKEYLKVNPLPKLKTDLPKENNLDGWWFYEENLTERKFKEMNINITPQQIEKLRKELNDLYENKKINKPTPYYAIIYLDGDNMGKWLSGELLPEIQYAYNSEVWNKKLPKNFKDELQEKLRQISKDKIPHKLLSPAIHSAISTALRNYTIEFVRKIVEEEFLGKLIYAGGDDVLAFVNLKDLFDVMEKLRWAFSGQIRVENGKIKVDLNNESGFVLKDGVYYLTIGKNATCSMGVVIAHYKEPLKIIIDKVFEMSKKAKNEGKNRFAISLIKKSGEERIGIAEWKIDAKLTTEILKTIKELMNKNREDKNYISDGFIQKLKREFSKFEKINILEEIFRIELKRLIIRAYNWEKETKKNFPEIFYENAIMLFQATGTDIDNFINLLEIASFMNRED